MENHGLIIRHLRRLAGLNVQQTAKKISRSTGWLSAVENNTGNCRLTESEFNRIVELLDGIKHRPMFKTWVSVYKKERASKTFDGAILKYFRLKKELSLGELSELSKLSVSYLSELETGKKSVTLELRNQIMLAYGYSITTFKNYITDPARAKTIPTSFKFEILLNTMKDDQIEKIFQFAQVILETQISENKNLEDKGESDGTR